MKMVEINKNPFESHIIGIFICSIFQYTNTVVNLLTIHFVLQIRTESESSGDDPYTSLHVFQINTHEIFCSDLPSYIWMYFFPRNIQLHKRNRHEHLSMYCHFYAPRNYCQYDIANICFVSFVVYNFFFEINGQKTINLYIGILKKGRHFQVRLWTTFPFTLSLSLILSFSLSWCTVIYLQTTKKWLFNTCFVCTFDCIELDTGMGIECTKRSRFNMFEWKTINYQPKNVFELFLIIKTTWISLKAICWSSYISGVTFWDFKNQWCASKILFPFSSSFALFGCFLRRRSSELLEFFTDAIFAMFNVKLFITLIPLSHESLTKNPFNSQIYSILFQMYRLFGTTLLYIFLMQRSTLILNFPTTNLFNSNHDAMWQ